ncbi:MAG: hypothetical protein SO415_02710 [Oliverpabstia sp.]|nr:hypothetical protein [Oliverpabstia sp.]
MKKKNKIFSALPVTLLAASAVLLAGSTVGSARAALTYYSENYAAEVTVSSIGVSLMENGTVVASRDYNHRNDQWNEKSGKLLENTFEDGKLVPGKIYDEKLSVTNSGSIDNYVRVTLYKSWMDENGNKVTTLAPDLIKLNGLGGEGWIIDENSSTEERTVLYYTRPVPAGAGTPNLMDTITVDKVIADKVEKIPGQDAAGNETITYKYKYDGYSFNLDAEVDAVQTHNAEDAIKSAWGVDVSVSSDGTLSLR